MKTIGFPISHKENEQRRTIIPKDLNDKYYCNNIFIEEGYGENLGITDDEYKEKGCHVCSRDKVLSQDIICDPKIGDAEYLTDLNEGQIIFGWVHATQNRDITDKLIDRKLTAYAWESMFEKGRHVFWRNNELAGEAAIIHAFQCYGKLPYETKVAVLGNGNTARGAMKILNMMGADVIQYNRKTENLFREEAYKYDVLVNCILWDTSRKDHIIYRKDLKDMKKGAMIIDVSCDKNGGIESSIPTAIEDPIYYVDGVCHYVVDHTPTIFYQTFSYDNSEVIVPYIKELMDDKCGKVLNDCLIIKNGNIIDEEIIRFQNR